MKLDLIKTKEKDRFETQYYAACLCEYVPILSMHQEGKYTESSGICDILCHNSAKNV